MDRAEGRYLSAADRAFGEGMEYDDALERKLVERITVRDDSFVVWFKSGIELEV